MKQNTIAFLMIVSLVVFLGISSTPAWGADCGITATVKFGYPTTSMKSPVKSVTINIDGVNVAINGLGQLLSTPNSAVNYNYDNGNKRYSSVYYKGGYLRFVYTNSGNIYSINWRGGPTLYFAYTNSGNLYSINYLGHIQYFYYNNSGTLMKISNAIKCISTALSN